MLVTESPHPGTSDIDSASPRDRAHMLARANLEIIDGFNEAARTSVESLASKIRDMISSCGRIILHGAGTSGRLAVYSANEYNSILGKELFYGIIAGGYPAMVMSIEGAEDDVSGGQRDLEHAALGSRKSIYVSISCSGGAKCNLGALHSASLDERIERAAILFNPIAELDNTSQVPSIGRTTREIYSAFGDSELVINPVIGPEPITGSTRMKGGTATMMILDMAFRLAINYSSPMIHQMGISEMLDKYAKSFEALDRSAGQIAQVAELAARALLNGGHVYYVGDDHGHSPVALRVWPSAGLLGILDASECLPTFGASFDDFRGFTRGGWSGILTEAQLRRTDANFMKTKPISLEDFRPLPGPNDLVIALLDSRGERPDISSYLNTAHIKGAEIRYLKANGRNGQSSDHRVYLPEVPNGFEPRFNGFEKAVLKSALNMISTGAYTSLGKIYGNRMVDLRLSNDKLIERGSRIVNELTGVPLEQVRAYFKAVQMHSGESNYADVKYMVPLTILTIRGVPYQTAVSELNKIRNIRQVLHNHGLRA
jgi:N-acetylmuramic acid 6-phosphate (MurNAc-6-P) etherase